MWLGKQKKCLFPTTRNLQHFQKNVSMFQGWDGRVCPMFQIIFWTWPRFFNTSLFILAAAWNTHLAQIDQGRLPFNYWRQLCHPRPKRLIFRYACISWILYAHTSGIWLPQQHKNYIGFIIWLVIGILSQSQKIFLSSKNIPLNLQIPEGVTWR